MNGHHKVVVTSLAFALLCGLASLSGCAKEAAARPPQQPDSSVTTAPPGQLPVVQTPTEFAEDDPFERFWGMPDLGAQEPGFPWLPGEDRTLSRSIGSVSYGYLVNAHQIRFPHPSLAMLERQSHRALNFTSDPMFEAVEFASKHVQQTYPGAVTYLGNFSAQGGGDIPYSVSHNSGRDADVAFFVTSTVEGTPYVMHDLLPLDDEGRYMPSEEQQLQENIFAQKDRVPLSFDVARNWRFIEGLMLWGGLDGKIQYVFVSNPLKKMLLDYARAEGASSDEVIDAADRILWQPRSALPHNDHFHIRLHCSDVDYASGCDGRVYSTKEGRSASALHEMSVMQASKILTDGDSVDDGAVVAAMRRLALLNIRRYDSKIASYLEDERPLVRASAARALADLDRGSKELGERLAREEHPRVLAELVVGLGRLGGKRSYSALSAQLSEPVMVELGERELDARVLIVDQLSMAEDKRVVQPLIRLLEQLVTENQTPTARRLELAMRTARALRWLTNQDPVQRLVVERNLGAFAEGDPEQQLALTSKAWMLWWDGNKKKRREQWLVEGFEFAGYKVVRLDRKRVWPLCRVIASEQKYLSYNAQRSLMKMFNHHPLSLEWSKEDASFYWRRWLERRMRRFRLPRIPVELSTLKKN